MKALILFEEVVYNLDGYAGGPLRDKSNIQALPKMFIYGSRLTSGFAYYLLSPGPWYILLSITAGKLKKHSLMEHKPISRCVYLCTDRYCLCKGLDYTDIHLVFSTY